MKRRSRPSKNWETFRPLAPKYEKSGKAEAYAFRRQSRPLHFCRLFRIGSQNRFSLRHQPCGRQCRRWWCRLTPDAHRRRTSLPWTTNYPIIRLSWWGRCLGPANSPTSLSDLCLTGSKWLTRRAGHSCWSCIFWRRLYAYLGLLANGVESTPGMKRLALLMFNQEGEVHLLHFFFYVPFGTYAT